VGVRPALNRLSRDEKGRLLWTRDRTWWFDKRRRAETLSSSH